MSRRIPHSQLYKIMKRHILALLSVLLIATCASAQLRFGVKAGLAVNDLRMNRSTFDSNNRAGFTGGLALDLRLPISGFALDASLLYTHRSADLSTETQRFRRDYLEIPVNLRYHIRIVPISSLLTPFVFTGPSFSFLFHEDGPTNYDNSTMVMSWNVGAGIELLRHLQVAASYGFGISKTIKRIESDYSGEDVNGKDSYWTLTATYFF